MLNLYVRLMQGTASSKSKACSLASVQVPAYRLKLPPKRLFVHNPTPDFVEERRQQLDTYLQMLLQERQLQGLHYSSSAITSPADGYSVHLYAAAPSAHLPDPSFKLLFIKDLLTLTDHDNQPLT